MRKIKLIGIVGLALAVGFPAASQPIDPNNPLYATPSKDEILVQLADTLGEPRGFCLDFPGFPASGVVANYRESAWPLGAHTCKTNIDHANVALIDQLFQQSALPIAGGRLRFSRLNRCVEVLTFRGVVVPGHVEETTIRQDAPLVANSCSDALEQQVVFGRDGRIRPVADRRKCLTIGKEAFEAGDRSPGQPWYRRDVNFSTCTDADSARQIWRALPPA